MNKIKAYIKSKIGSKVIVVSLQNRNREERYVGIIEKAYKNLFTITMNNGQSKCFSYVDILTGNVRVYI